MADWHSYKISPLKKNIVIYEETKYMH